MLRVAEKRVKELLQRAEEKQRKEQSREAEQQKSS